MVLASEASTPVPYCPEHAHLFRGKGSGPRTTTCPCGHDLLVPSNTYKDGAGHVRCRVCARERRQERERRRAELDARVCAWGDCNVSLRGTPHSRRYCDACREEAARAKVREWHAKHRPSERAVEAAT